MSTDSPAILIAAIATAIASLITALGGFLTILWNLRIAERKRLEDKEEMKEVAIRQSEKIKNDLSLTEAKVAFKLVATVKEVETIALDKAEEIKKALAEKDKIADRKREETLAKISEVKDVAEVIHKITNSATAALTQKYDDSAKLVGDLKGEIATLKGELSKLRRALIPVANPVVTKTNGSGHQ